MTVLRVRTFREGRCYLAGQLPPANAITHLQLSQTSEELRNKLADEWLGTTDFALIRSRVWVGGGDEEDDRIDGDLDSEPDL